MESIPGRRWLRAIKVFVHSLWTVIYLLTSALCPSRHSLVWPPLLLNGEVQLAAMEDVSDSELLLYVRLSECQHTTACGHPLTDH